MYYSTFTQCNINCIIAVLYSSFVLCGVIAVVKQLHSRYPEKNQKTSFPVAFIENIHNYELYTVSVYAVLHFSNKCNFLTSKVTADECMRPGHWKSNPFVPFPHPKMVNLTKKSLLICFIRAKSVNCDLLLCGVCYNPTSLWSTLSCTVHKLK